MTVTVALPQALADLPEEERVLLLQAGLYEARRARIRQLEAEALEAEAEVERLESHYGMSLCRASGSCDQANESVRP